MYCGCLCATVNVSDQVTRMLVIRRFIMVDIGCLLYFIGKSRIHPAFSINFSNHGTTLLALDTLIDTSSAVIS